MDRKSKIFLVFLGIVSLAACGLAAWIYLSAQTEITEYAKKQDELKQANTRLQEKLAATQEEAQHWQEKSNLITGTLNKMGKEHTLLLSKYDSLLKEKDSFAKRNEALKEQLESLSKLYTQEREKPKIDTSDKFLASLLKEKAQLEVEIEKLKSKIDSQELKLTEEKLAQLEKEKGELEKKLADAQKVAQVLSNDLLQERKKRAVLEEEKGILPEKLPETEKTSQTVPLSIELSPIIVKAEQEPPLQRLGKAQVKEAEETLTLGGRIITVNDKHKFVVIDKGSDDGVRKGMSFNVYRKEKKVGRVVVIETRKNIAACDIKEMHKHFEVNDTVRR